MAPHMPNGRGCGLILSFFAFLLPGFSQSTLLSCTASAAPALVRAEGVTERTGDILLQCTGSVTGSTTSGNIGLFYPVNVTNRVDVNNAATDITLTVDTGSGPVPAGVPAQIAGQSVTFGGINFSLTSSSRVTLRVSGVRLNVSQLGAANTQGLQAFLSTSLGAVATRSPLIVGQPGRALLATFASGGISCAGSPVPSQVSFSSLLAAGTRFASTRITEGFPSAFETKDATSDSGTRIIARYTGIPAGAHIFVPDVVAGSDAAEPTSGGDLGLPQAVGRYVPGSGTLLLSRVAGTDANGTGGQALYTPGASGPGAVSLDFASELPAANGTAFAVYEVMDAGAPAIESAQFPTFVGIANVTANATIQETLSLAPLSTNNAASVSAPVPRFAPFDPASDCTALGDCNAVSAPRLAVAGQGWQFTAIAGGAAQQGPGYITVNNSGGGVMSWTATAGYKSGAGWLSLSPTSGVNAASVFASVNPQNLAAGTYAATITVDAGPLAGSASLVVTLTVSPAPTTPVPPPVTPAAPPVVISTVTNAANFLFSPMAPGSLVTVKGSHLSGQNVTVQVDGFTAKLFYVSDTQINLLLPVELAGRTAATLVVAMDGQQSAGQRVSLAPVAPAVFAAVNQDGTVNGTASPAPPGSIISVYATGLLPGGSGIYVKIHDRDNLAPAYAGPVSWADGLQQINVQVPADLPAMTTSLLVCAYDPGGKADCSHPANLTLSQGRQ